MTVNDKHRKPSDMQRSISLLLVIAMLATIFVVSPFSVSAADPAYVEFSSGAVLLDSSYSGANVLIKNGVFSVTVSGATNVNIIFESVTMDRRYASDTNGTVQNLYNVSQSLGWVKNDGTYTAQTCPLLLTNNASATVAFRGVNNFYAGTNGCTVSNTNYYTKNQSGGGFAGIQVDSGSTLTIAQSGGTLNVHGAFYVETDNSNNVPNTNLYENDSVGYGWPSGAQTDLSGGAGIGGGAAWNTTTSASQNYTAGTPGTIIINGGNINAHGGHQAAGIGGGLNGAATSTSITINGGNVAAYGGRWAPGIGDGDSLQNNWTTKYKDSYSIDINGGTIQATGGVNCPGIGTADEVSANQTRKDTSGLTIQLNGGEITARSGYPDGFNPNGTAGYSGTDAAAAIGAGNNTNMHSNSIHVSSAAKIIASGFGHYSVTENGVNHETLPTVNIDSDSYAFLGRFPELTSHTERPFELFEAQRFDVAIGDKTYQYVKYVTQPANGSAGEIYYYCPEAPDNKWLKKAGADGTIENAADVSLDSLSALETKIEELMLTLYVDEGSVKIGEIISPAHFRSIALTLPNPEEHGGIYALKIPTDALYGYHGQATLPAVGYVVITIGAQEQGVLSGEIAYPGKLNIKADAVSETLTDLDIYRDASHTDGRNGLIGDKFMENMFAYRVYIESTDDMAYLYAKFEPNDTTLVSLEELSGAHLDVDSATGIVTATIDMTDLTEKVIRLKKTDTVTVDGKAETLHSVVYKITIVKKAEYKIELNPLDKIYDGMAVKPSIVRLYSEETNEEYIPTEAELNSVEYTYYRQDDTAWTPIGAAPKDAGTYKVSARIAAVSYNATSETQFTISKRTVTVNRIEYPLTYVSSAEYNAGWTGTGTTHRVENPGRIFLNNVISGDDLSATAASIFYNDITIGYKADKITLEGITLSGASVHNYEPADTTQRVFGQISYKLDQAIFKKKPGQHWDKFYPVDSKDPVKPETADYHSPVTDIGGEKVYDTHGDHVYARTENTGEDQSIYAVDIEFGAMYFSYSKSQWNPNTMTYEELADESRWTGFEGENNRVTVINRSNRAVYYAPHVRIDFLHSAIGDSTTGIKANFYKTNADTGTIITGIKQELSAATAGNTAALGTASREMCYIRLSGVPQLAESDQFTVVGGVTVTISRTNE